MYTGRNAVERLIEQMELTQTYSGRRRCRE